MMQVAATAQADTATEFLEATKVSEIKKMGAQQMDGVSITRNFLGNTLTSPNWNWTFKSNGEQFSSARDGSWEDKGTWSVKGNELCRISRTTQGPERCSKVYFLGRELRFTEGNRKLHDWYVSC